jgi:hypothetical protein
MRSWTIGDNLVVHLPKGWTFFFVEEFKYSDMGTLRCPKCDCESVTTRKAGQIFICSCEAVADQEVFAMLSRVVSPWEVKPIRRREAVMATRKKYA